MPDLYDIRREILANRQLNTSAAALNIRLGVGQSPDQAAAQRIVAQRLGVPTSTVAADPGLVEHDKTVQTRRVVDDNAILRDWYAKNPDAAAVSHDDVGVLARIGSLVTTALTPLARGIDSAIMNDEPVIPKLKAARQDLTLGNAGRALGAGAVDLGTGVLGIGEAMSEADAAFDDMYFGSGRPTPVSDFFRNARRATQGYAESIAPTPKTSAGNDILSGVRSIPGSIGAAAATLATGNPYVGATVLGGVTGGQSYGQARDDGFSVGRSATKAGIDAAVETGTELLPEAMLLHDFGKTSLGKFIWDQIKTEVPGEQLATLGQDFNQWALLDANKGKSFDDYVSEILPHAWSTLVSTLVATAPMAGVGALGKLANRSANSDAQVQHAEMVRQHLQDLSDLAAASKTRERDPESFHDFVASAVDDTPVEDVYIDPKVLGETLAQSELEPQQRKIVEERIAPRMLEALEQGTDARVGVADFAAALAGTPAEKVLLDHAKLEPNAMSKAEADTFMETRGNALLDEIKQAQAHAESDAATKADVEKVRTEILDQLQKANRFTAAVNERYADLHAAFYSTMAPRVGKSVADFYAAHPVNIQSAILGGSENMLDQGARGTRLYHGSNRADLSLDQIEIVRPSGQKQGKKGRVYGGFYAAAENRLADAQGYAGENGTVYAVDLKPDAVIEDKQGDITRLPEKTIADYRARGVDVVRGVDPRGRTEYAIINKDAIERLAQHQPAQEYAQDHPIFYSALERAIENTNQAKASADQWLATLAKTPGVKKEELEWSGLPDWLKLQGGPVTREELLGFIREGGVQVDEVVLGEVDPRAVEDRAMELRDAYVDELMADYEPGDVATDYPDIVEVYDNYEGEEPTGWEVNGETFDSYEAAQAAADAYADERDAEAQRQAEDDYREQLEDRVGWHEFEEQARSEVGALTEFGDYTESGGEDYRELLLTLPNVKGPSTHWSEPNVVAHLRFKTRQSADGKKVMFIEEVQSDWHQKGRDEGYRQPGSAEVVAEAEAAMNAAIAEQDVASRALIEFTLHRLQEQTGGYDPDLLAESTWGRSQRSRIEKLQSALARGDFYGGAREAKYMLNQSAWVGEITNDPEEARRWSEIEANYRQSELRAIETATAWRNAKEGRGIPDAPFKTSWPALVMKRAIRWAVDNGFEQVAWTTGEQQRERYDLAERVGVLDVTKEGEFYRVSASNANLGPLLQQQGHAVRSGNDAMVTPDKMIEVFGKDLGTRMMQAADALAPSAEEKAKLDEEAAELHAQLKAMSVEDVNSPEYDRIITRREEVNERRRELENTTATLDGEDLKIGGEGMLGFYDRNLVNITNDLVKKYGAKVRPIEIQEFQPAPSTASWVKSKMSVLGGEEGIQEMLAELEAEDAANGNDPNNRAIRNLRPLLSRNGSPLVVNADTLRAWLEIGRDPDEQDQAVSNPGFDITPELKEVAQAGFALFQRQRGAYSPATDTITLLQNADLSTFLHESGHFFLEVMHRLASDAGAPQQIRDDFETLLNWFGVKDFAAWDAMTLEQKRQSHEKFARGFEAYLFTGKAPSIKLTGLFQRFRAWLVAVYKKALALNVSVSPQVRGVMDRMLATDAEIEEAEAARSMIPMLGLEQHMTEDEWRAYQQLGQKATADAAGDLEARSLRDMRWLANAKGREINRLKREAKATRAQTRAQVARDVLSEPVYRALTFLKSGIVDGQKIDGPHKLYTPEIAAEYGEEKSALLEQLRGMTTSTPENAIHPAQVAELFGFSSVDHLLVELTSAEPLNEKIEGLTEQRLLEEHGDLTDPQAIEAAADKAVHNEARARFVAAELAALAKAVGDRKTLAPAARAYAEAAIARQRVRDVKPSIHEAAAARAARAAEKALKEGNLHAAAAEKRNQLINLHMAREANRARTDVERALAYLGRLARLNPKNIAPEYREQIDNILGALDLRPSTSLRAIDRIESFKAWAEKQREMGLDPIADESVFDLPRSYKQMTVEELRGLVDSLKNIEHLGRLKNRLLTARRQRDFDTAVATAASTIHEFAVTSRKVRRGAPNWLQRKQDNILDFLALHRKFASLIRQMDGFRDGGPLWDLFVRPMNAAADRETAMRAEAGARLAEILDPVLGKELSRKTYIPEIGDSLSLRERLAVALNLGNAINRERLMTGERWTHDQVHAIVEPLTADHWRVVQQLWDYIGSYWPEIAAKELRVSGVAPERVDPAPLTVHTSDGETLDLAGGYYPIKYDTARAMKPGQHDLAQMVKDSLNGAYSRATTRRGHTKARVESTGWPLSLDLGVIFGHFNQVLHDLAWHEYLIDATRLMRTNAIDSAIREHYGPEIIRAMNSALTDMAIGDQPAANSFERVIEHLRSGTSIAGMAWSMTTALLQPLGLSQSIVRIGPKWVAKGLARWLGDTSRMQNTVAWIAEQSPMMASRAKTMQREIADLRNQINGKDSTLRASFFVLTAKLQLVADVPTWIGQYEKSVDGGLSHEEAVAQADQAVLDSQGGGQIKDLAGIQRGNSLLGLWSTFYSYFNTSYNMIAESVGETRLVGPKRLPILAGDVLLISVLPAVFQTLVLSALRGDDRDWEDIGKDAAKNVASSFLGLMVGLRDIGSIIQSDGRSSAPAGVVLGRMAEFYKQAEQLEADEAFWRALNNMAGPILHYPAAQVDRTARGFLALKNGDTYNPLALLVGPPRKSVSR